MTRWIHVLPPYLVGAGRVSIRNGALESWREGLSAPFGGGPTTEALPSGLSRVPLRWKLALVGGFAGVGQDPATGRVRPELGWAVAPASR